jgi:hypothetical protein
MVSKSDCRHKINVTNGICAIKCHNAAVGRSQKAISFQLSAGKRKDFVQFNILIAKKLDCSHDKIRPRKQEVGR